MKKQVSSRGLLAALVWFVLTIPVIVAAIIGSIGEVLEKAATKFIEACTSLVGRCEGFGSVWIVKWRR